MILPDDGGKAALWQIELESGKAVKYREHGPGPRLAALRSDWLFAYHAAALAGSFQLRGKHRAMLVLFPKRG
jgi:hypothetical protein